MRIAISQILSSDHLSEIRSALAAVRFVDGKSSAGFAARTVKDNLQADPADLRLSGVRALVEKQITGNDVFQIAARPKQLSPLLFSRHEEGMRYGLHVDNALMGGMRTDVAFTLFLNEPTDYDGGELVIDTHDGEEAIKLPAGSMIVYPATSLHRVAQVTRGVRYVAAGWARSFIRDASQRELLFDLDTARRAIFARDGKSGDFDLLSKTLANLIRMWADD